MTDRTRPPRPTVNRLAGYGATFADQVVISSAGFALSWLAANRLDTAELAVFALGWQWALGFVSVGSEALATPALLAVSSGSRTRAQIEGPLVGGMLPVGFLLLLTSLLPLSGAASVVIAAAAAGTGGLAFSIVRGLHYAEGAPARSLRLATARAVVTLLLVAPAIGLGRYSARAGLAIGGAAFLMPLVRRWRRSTGHLSSTLGLLLRDGSWYALATGARFVGYSAGLMTVVGVTRGASDTAVVAAMIILAGPTQLVSSSLPMVFMAELSEAPPFGLMKVVARQLGVLLTVLALGLVMTSMLYGWWVSITLGDPSLESELGEALPAFVALVAGIVLTSYLGAAMKALGQPVTFTILTTVSGAVALASTVSTLPTVWLPASPYMVATALMGAAVLARLTSKRGAP